MRPLLLISLITLCGCAGQNARKHLLCPAIQEAWASVRSDATPVEPMDAAVVDCACPDLPIAWELTDVQPTGEPFYKAEKVETVRQLDEMIELMCKDEYVK